MNEFQLGEERHGLNLREYLTILRVRKWWIVLATILVVGSALAYSFQQTPIYVSQAEVHVESASLSPERPLPALNMETEKELAQSTEVARFAAEELGEDKSQVYTLLANLSVDVIQNTEILTFSYASSDPEAAADRANAFAQAYLASRFERVQQGLEVQRDMIERQIEAAQRARARADDDIEDAQYEA